MNASPPIGALFAAVTAAAEDAAAASLQGHNGATHEICRQTRQHLLEALIALHKAETALETDRIGPLALIPASELDEVCRRLSRAGQGSSVAQPRPWLRNFSIDDDRKLQLRGMESTATNGSKHEHDN